MDVVDLSQQVIDAAQERAVARSRKALDGAGSDECADCGGDIGKLRRAAMPSATRCIACQCAFEKSARR